jgi:hypothetical protein
LTTLGDFGARPKECNSHTAAACPCRRTLGYFSTTFVLLAVTTTQIILLLVVLDVDQGQILWITLHVACGIDRLTVRTYDPTCCVHLSDAVLAQGVPATYKQTGYERHVIERPTTRKTIHS